MFDYYQWLLEKVECPTAYNHSLLLKDLHATIFDSKVKRDANRAADGVDLRYEYMDEENINEKRYTDDRECSVLEMMVSMAMRFAYNVIGIDFAPPSFWFWKMVENMDLLVATDENYDGAYVNQQVELMLSRKYKTDGRGGMFPLKYANSDQRRVELWYQMCAWFEENYGIDVHDGR